MLAESLNAAEMRSIEDLERLLSASNTLLERVHSACSGFPKGSKCRMFVETYHEVCLREAEEFVISSKLLSPSLIHHMWKGTFPLYI